MLKGADTVGDIGCDHGRLSVALIEQGVCRRVIAVDISAPSLEKARALARLAGIEGAVETRLGDGLAPIGPGEADAVAICGMGGTLMRAMLSAQASPLGGARLGVFQPMRGVADIRAFLYEQGYWIVDDRIVLERGRYYQVFSARPPQEGPLTRQPLPDGWPSDCFFLGYTAFARQDPLLPAYASLLLSQRNARLSRAAVPLMRRQADQLMQILQTTQDK